MRSAGYFWIVAGVLSLSVSCNRSSDNSETYEQGGAALKNMSKVDPEDPFSGQPNNLCTVIRILPATDIAEPEDKYCLLDVCLDAGEESLLTVDLGDGEDHAMAAYKLIKVFSTADEARQYAAQYQIIDVLITD